MKKKLNHKIDIYLKKGDLVDIVAPGSACDLQHLEQAAKWLKSRGFEVRYSSDILKPMHYLAQSDDFRFKDLKRALLAKDSKAVWCLRGGYGSFRLWPKLLKTKKPKHQKMFIGLSDITSLHQFLNQKWQWPTLHASLLDRVGQNKLTAENEAELLATIRGDADFVEFSDLIALNKNAQNLKKIEGQIRGGNLATFVVSLASDLHPKYKKSENVILFFEDIGERGYKVDRFLQHLKQAGVFENVRAVVFGDFTESLEKNGLNLVDYTLSEFAQSVKIPVFKGLQAGHGHIQKPLFFKTKAELYGGKNSYLVVNRY